MRVNHNHWIVLTIVESQPWQYSNLNIILQFIFNLKIKISSGCTVVSLSFRQLSLSFVLEISFLPALRFFLIRKSLYLVCMCMCNLKWSIIRAERDPRNNLVQSFFYSKRKWETWCGLMKSKISSFSPSLASKTYHLPSMRLAIPKTPGKHWCRKQTQPLSAWSL